VGAEGDAVTLADLAAMAATVGGFVRPLKYCDECDDPMDSPGKVRDDYGQTRTCVWCVGTGTELDNSPAALAMAVLTIPGLSVRTIFQDPGAPQVSVLRLADATLSHAVSDGTAEGIARALLTALLRAHGVEVPSE
jgi:hypothetical protein